MVRTSSGSKKKVAAAPKRKKNDPIKNEAPEFPEGWISVAAYYIWEEEGHPAGRDINHWFEAKAQLRDLWTRGSLPAIQ